MLPRLGSVLGMLLLVAGCAATGSVSLPGPSDVTIVPPASSLPPQLKAFSGVWEGVWDGQLASRLTVESIENDSARVIYAWDDQPPYFKAGWGRYRAKVSPEGKLEFGSSQTRFTFRMSQDLSKIEGEREASGRLNSVTMKKVSQ